MKTTLKLGLAAGLFIASGATALYADAHQKLMTFHLDAAAGDMLSLTHAGDLGPRRVPEGISLLEDEAINRGLVLSALLRDENGDVVGLATELEYFPEGQRPGVSWDTYWTVLLPGRGSIYGFETEEIPAEHLPLFIARANGTPFKGENRAKIASGPAEGGLGIIVGGTGEFEGATGTIAEFYVLKELPMDGSIVGTLELEIRIDE